LIKSPSIKGTGANGVFSKVTSNESQKSAVALRCSKFDVVLFVTVTTTFSGALKTSKSLVEF
jgi:hypothetical protein